MLILFDPLTKDKQCNLLDRFHKTMVISNVPFEVSLAPIFKILDFQFPTHKIFIYTIIYLLYPI